MRTRRIKEDGAGYYHVVSRIVDRRMILTDAEKERFRRIMRAVEGFSGCQVLTYAVLTNHFHALLYVPDRENLSDQELTERLGYLYRPREVVTIEGRLRTLRESGDDQGAEALRAPYLRRMFDLSEYVKEVKQRFSRSYNHRHGRKGTLWEERFRSVLLEGNVGTLSTVAAYIDLNPMRAGIVDDPKDYRFSGYGEAMDGSREARQGIRRVMSSLDRPATWGQAASGYRKLLYAAAAPRGAAEEGAHARRSFTAEQVEAVAKADGTLPKSVLMRCRVRYFTDGAILGTQAFVNAAFSRHRDRFGARRQTGARPMVGDWGGLCTARRLRVNVISVPVPV